MWRLSFVFTSLPQLVNGKRTLCPLFTNLTNTRTRIQFALSFALNPPLLPILWGESMVVKWESSSSLRSSTLASLSIHLNHNKTRNIKYSMFLSLCTNSNCQLKSPTLAETKWWHWWVISHLSTCSFPTVSMRRIVLSWSRNEIKKLSSAFKALKSP